ncbi:PREDICTED: uncharacterized protein LOC108561891 [Nicrophorus vespilloides]|uniref:Uncharacterized protein LOC108561891 n=1 Tax=Nicrophorus vespilloides TaxID=110193 RepID=A0ABM1MLP7_NICVS|nr:PREDICTED: uncharacterized protein LOC108561891 [Nicrophorus vespilloides]XP_017775497.1 PREDICTED: uncharacterized protein LOC108561891 [Nicrophorus vespilloides]XP_017775498.1 PREDICTED: uncharacterized protein LOC108561891 [Nicrophorus vespilloides]
MAVSNRTPQLNNKSASTRKMDVTAFLTIILILLFHGADGLKSLIIRVPQVVKSGDTVTLSCNYDLEEVALYTIKWYRNDVEFYRFVPKESPPSRAFTMPHIHVDIAKSGPTEVTLRGVRKELSGDYKCEVSADAPLFHTEIKMAHMTIIEVPSGSPSLEIEPKKVEVGKRIVAMCSTTGSTPAANITWYINDELVTPHNDDVKIFPTRHEPEIDDADLQTSKSRIEIIANKSYFITGPMILKCEATIYSAWNRYTDGFIRDETPLLAPVLLSTSSQTHDDDNFDIFGHNGSPVRLDRMVLNVLIALQLLLFR